MLLEWSIFNEHNYHKSTSINGNDNIVTADPIPSTSADDANNASLIEQPSCSYASTSHSSVSKTVDMIQEGELSVSVPKRMINVQHVTPKQRVTNFKKKMSSKQWKFSNGVLNHANNFLGESPAKRLEGAVNLCKDAAFIKNLSFLNKQAQAFIMMQLKQVRKNKMARRFSLDDKLMALNILKQSPKAYKFLEQMFALPSKRTLERLSQKINIDTGINPKIFQYLKNQSKNWNTKKRLCTILFDEVALTPHLTFNESKDKIHGFVDVAGERKYKFCDHALVIMIRGICSPWRQAIAYYFCEGTVPAIELQKILKQIVPEVANTGLIPLGIVCDQGSTFRTAINNLRQDTVRLRNSKEMRDDGTIHLAGHDLSIFYDPPHLLKGLRNNFLTKDILLDEKTASWKDIMLIYDLDVSFGHTRAMPKLTAQHVDPKKIKKMKVSIAAQVLSARTAAMLNYTNSVSIHNGKEPMSPTMKNTADVVEFIDELFDSVNGHPGGSKKGKLRKAVKENSSHRQFWINAIKKLKNIKFIDANSKHAIQSGKSRLVRVPSLQGWITSLESFIRMSDILFKTYDVEYFYPRYINQDPLENFFGRIRAMNYRNVNPDSNTFINSFKTLIISNVLSPHSRHANCEDDAGENIIDMNYLFIDDDNDRNENDSQNINTISIASSSSVSELNLADQVKLEKMKVQTSAYTAGYICRKLKNTNECSECTKTYLTKEIGTVHKYIQHREYKLLKNNNLKYPTEKLVILYREATQYIHNYLNKYADQNNVTKNIKEILTQKLNFSWLGCHKHKKNIWNAFLKIINRVQIHNWTNIINKIMKGVIDEKYVNKMELPQKIAYKKYVALRVKRKINK